MPNASCDSSALEREYEPKYVSAFYLIASAKMPVFSLQCMKDVTTALSRCEWIGFYCLRWWNRQQFFQCFGLDADSTTRRSVYWRAAAATSCVGVLRHEESVYISAGIHTYILFLPPISFSCHKQNAADLCSPLLSSPHPCSTYGWGEAGCRGNHFTEAMGAPNWEGKGALWVTENKSLRCRRRVLQSAQPRRFLG